MVVQGFLSFVLMNYWWVWDIPVNSSSVFVCLQCEQLETELSGLLHQRRTMFRSCLDLLHTYATVTSLVSDFEVCSNPIEARIFFKVFFFVKMLTCLQCSLICSWFNSFTQGFGFLNWLFIKNISNNIWKFVSTAFLCFQNYKLFKITSAIFSCLCSLYGHHSTVVRALSS